MIGRDEGTGGPRRPARILVVEDDENLRLALADNLEDEGYEVVAAATGAEGRAALAGGSPFGVVILDVMLPDTDGYAFCRAMRDAGDRTMVLMLTARTLERDLVEGFDAGADDYLGKPYRLRELLARVRALLRRGGGASAPPATALGHVTVDRAARELREAGGTPISLTRTEYDLLVFLLDHPGRALTRDELLDAVWGADVMVDPRTVDNFVSSLKKKLGWSEEAPWSIRTVRGVGYRFEI